MGVINTAILDLLPDATPEDHARALRLLARHDAHDLIEVLGLEGL